MAAGLPSQAKDERMSPMFAIFQVESGCVREEVVVAEEVPMMRKMTAACINCH